ncbi:MAG: hypothetical protein AAGC46_06160 [Solirubrobacteraceae bacterium]|nr:hypothetical protein [Patulibacter sp.]
MTTTTTPTAGGAVRPGANWGGWLGYGPAARGPEARRARAEAAGLIGPTATATPTITVTHVPASSRPVQMRRSRGALDCRARRIESATAR